METVTTEQGNKLIAEFMGGVLKPFKIGSSSHLVWQSDIDKNLAGIPEYQALCYHTSWDWLMPVVEKIESLEYEVQIGKHLYRVNDFYYCIIHNQGDRVYFETDESIKIKAVWLAVIDFLTYLNKMK